MTLIFFSKKAQVHSNRNLPSATTIIVCYFLPITIFLSIFLLIRTTFRLRNLTL